MPVCLRRLQPLQGGEFMGRRKASDFPQELLDLFDGYVHGEISRRDFWMARKNSPSAVRPRHHSSKRLSRTMLGPYKFQQTTNGSRPSTTPFRRLRGTEASRATSCVRRTRLNYPPSW